MDIQKNFPLSLFLIFYLLRTVCTESSISTLSSDVSTLKKKVENVILENKTLRKTVHGLIRTVEEMKREHNFLQNKLKSNRGRTGTNPARVGPRSVSYGTVAFSAYISEYFDLKIGYKYVFVYDGVHCNTGNAYNKHNGMFTTPVAGVYAFSYTIFAEAQKKSVKLHGEIDTELVVNSTPKLLNHVDSEASWDEDSSTGFVILNLNPGDVVYIRIRSSHPVQGAFQHYYKKRWTFSGWKL